MMYNTYRQYKTLSGVKKESKIDVINKLKPLTKNIFKCIPGDEYAKFKSRHEHIGYRLMIAADNRILAVQLLGIDSESTIVEQKNIKLPSLCYFRGIYDGSIDSQHDIIFKALSESGQVLPFHMLGIKATSDVTESQQSNNYFSPINEAPENYYVVTLATTYKFILEIPKTMAYAVLDFNVSDKSYDQLPLCPVTYFE